MDETRAPANPPAVSAGGRPSDGGSAAPDQPALPLLTFDDGADEPIGYALTARARREVAPEGVPPLRVVDPPRPDDDADLDRPGDTRPSRARALRRGGASLTTIAADLGVDELVVRAWVGDVGARVGRRRTGAAAADGSHAATAAVVTDPGPEGGAEHRAAFELARAAARDDAHARLTDPDFAAGLGVVSAILSVDEHAATLATGRLEVAAAAVRWLRSQGGLDGGTGLRVVLRLGPDVAGDLARHRWAAALGLATERVLHTRWRGAPSGDAVEALIRVPDTTLAASLAGWRDALLDGRHGTPLRDAGF